jgi:hypothetical protein
MPVIVQRRCPPHRSPVENIPLQAERHSGRRQKVFAFPPERCSPSDRNAVRDHNGMVFGFTPESRSPSTGFPKYALNLFVSGVIGNNTNELNYVEQTGSADPVKRVLMKAGSLPISHS